METNGTYSWKPAPPQKPVNWKKTRNIILTVVLAVVLLALVLSCLMAWMPVLREVSPGVAIVLCTVAAAGIGAWLFPIPDPEVAA